MAREHNEYFANEIETVPLCGVYLDLRAELALRFATHFAVVAGIPDGEDEAGRQKLRLLTPDEVVLRSFEIAEKFVEMAENCTYLSRGTLSVEDKARKIGQLGKLRMNAEYERETVGS